MSADDTSISLFHLDDITTDNLINDNVTIYSTFISQLEAPHYDLWRRRARDNESDIDKK